MIMQIVDKFLHIYISWHFFKLYLQKFSKSLISLRDSKNQRAITHRHVGEVRPSLKNIDVMIKQAGLHIAKMFGLRRTSLMVLLLSIINFTFVAQGADFKSQFSSCSESNPIQIGSAEDLVSLSQQVDENMFAGPLYVELSGDIDAAGVSGYVPFGYTLSYYLDGIELYFDGKGHSIKNLDITMPEDAVLVFGGFISTLKMGSLHDIKFENCTVNALYAGNDQVVMGAGIACAAVFSGSVENVETSGTINISALQNTMGVGGAIGSVYPFGYDETVVENITSEVELNVFRLDQYSSVSEIESGRLFGNYCIVGGTIGSVDVSSISTASPTTTVKNIKTLKNTKITVPTTGLTNTVGGVVGLVYKADKVTVLNIENLTNYCDVNVPQSDGVGGIVGAMSSTDTDVNFTLKGLYNGGQISGKNYVGGLVGLSIYTNIYNGINLGNVVGADAGSKHVGGIAGYYRIIECIDVTGINMSCCVNTGMVRNENEGSGSTGALIGDFLQIKPDKEQRHYPFYNCFNLQTQPSGTKIMTGNMMELAKPQFHSVYHDMNMGVEEGGLNQGVMALPTSKLTSDDLRLRYTIIGLDGNEADTLSKSEAENKGLEPVMELVEGLYPYISSGNDFSKIASAAFILADDETLAEVSSDFKVSTANGVVWKSEKGLIEINDGNASIKGSGEDELVASLNGLEKRFKMTLVKNVFGGGMGTEELPYIIKNKSHLQELADSVEVYGEKLKNRYFVLKADLVDIDFIVAPSAEHPFCGHFDGENHLVSLNVSGEAAGLFGYSNGAEIKNLEISGAVKGTTYAGGVCGQASNSDINHCFNTAQVSGMTAGGVVGSAQGGGKYHNLANSGTITGGKAVGGAVGMAQGPCELHDMVNAGCVSGSAGSGERYVGGLIGGIDASGSSMVNASVLMNYGSVIQGSMGGISPIVGYKNNAKTSGDMFDLQICQNNQVDVSLYTNGFGIKDLESPTGWARESDEYYPVPEWLAEMKDWSLLSMPLELANDEMASSVQSEPSVRSGMRFLGARKLGSEEKKESVMELQGSETTHVIVEMMLSEGFTGMKREVFVDVVGNPFGCGNGTAEDPYCISNKDDLETLSKLISGSENGYKFDYMSPRLDNWTNGKYFLQTADITGVTSAVGGDSFKEFEGSYNGDGHSVGVSISGGNGAALFSRIGAGSEVKNLHVSGRVIGKDTVAAVVAVAKDCKSLVNLSSSAEVIGNDMVGGVLAVVEGSEGTVEGLANGGKVSAKLLAGGVVAVSDADMTRLTNAGTVRSSASGSASGIVGRYSGEHLTYCSNAGYVSGGVAAGIVSENVKHGEVSNCFNLNTIKGETSYALSNDPSTNSYYDGQITLVGEGGKATSSLIKVSEGGYDIPLNENWRLSDAELFYPSLIYEMEAMDKISSLASAVVLLGGDDKADKVQNVFDLYSASEIEWSVRGGKDVLEIEKKESAAGTSAYKVTPKSVGTDTLVASLDGMEKIVGVRVDCVPKVRKISLSGCDTLMIPDENGEMIVVDKEGHSTISVVFKKEGADCDSTVIYDIDIHKPKVTIKDTVDCKPIVLTDEEGEFVTFTESDVFKVVENGCDTIVWNIRIIKAVTDTIVVDPDCGKVVYDGVEYSKSEVLTKIEKSKVCDCDSLVHKIMLTVNPVYEIIDTLPAAIDSMVYEGEVIRENTLKTVYDGASSLGCDSVRKVFIRIIDAKVETEDVYACERYVDSNNGSRVYSSDVQIFDTTWVGEEVSIKIRDVKIYHNSSKDTTYLEDVYGCGIATVTIDYGSREVISSFEKDTVLTIHIERPNKCDSITVQKVFVHEPVKTVTKDTIFACEKYEDIASGLVVDKNSTLKDTIKTVDLRCDSIIYAQPYVIEKLTFDTYKMTGCEEAEYQKMNGERLVVNYSLSFNDTLVSSHGCLSKIREVSISIANPIDIVIDTLSCSPIDFEGVTYTDGITEFVDTIPNKSGDCDSLIRHIKISVLDKIVKDSVVYGCQSVEVVGDTYTKSYQEIEKSVGKASNGVCDSFVFFRIYVLQPQEVDEYVKGCGSVVYEGVTYTQDTELVKHLSSKLCDCDSTVYVHIKIGHSDFVEVDTSDCSLVSLNGKIYTSDAIVDIPYVNTFGCDSIVRYHVHVLSPSYETISIEGESSVEYGGVTYRRSQTIVHKTVNSVGCDSIITVKIKINKDLGYPVIVDKFGYVLFCNNNIGDVMFSRYQWYKNGKLIEGATKDFYEEEQGKKLCGCYQVSVWNEAGREFASEIYCIEAERTLTIYPNPVEVNEPVYIDYEFTTEERKSLYVEVYSATGLLLREFKPSAYPIVIDGMGSLGQYFVLLRLNDEKVLNTKFIVK